ncbi:MAG: LysR family transcriptional regulator [Sulfuricella sp.]|nr:LysR family transcriptional regulator [Sulfuricella sp.]
MGAQHLSDLRIFTRVIKEGSLAAAGRELGFSSAVVSKRIQRLEEGIGVRLIQRSTRKLSLTDEGRLYHEYCVRILAELDEAETLLSSGSQEPSGTLRVTVPAAFGRQHVAPLVPGFLERHPKVRLSLHLSDQQVDLIEEGYDLAVRIGELRDSNLVVRPLGIDKRVLVASPGYLAQHGEPRCPQDLCNHNALLFANPSPLDLWNFVDAQGREHWVKVSGNFETNNCDALRETILAGQGIALRPLWDVWQDVRQGHMVALLKDYIHPAFPIQALYPNRRYLSQKVRAFIEMLREHFGEIPYWERA